MKIETKELSRRIQELLYDSGASLGTAESCTGGHIAEAIVAIPGASAYFKGGVVAYSNEVKVDVLGVSAQLLAERGAVCEEVAREMVVGVCSALHCTYAMATTGVAGPSGGSAEKPVGTIWIACGCKDDIRTCKLSQDHGRDRNLLLATHKALRMLADYLMEQKSAESGLK